MRTLLTALLLLPAVALAETVTFGPWSAETRDAGPGVVRYRGTAVCSHAGFSAYKPDWKGGNFGLDQAKLTVERTAERAALIWRRDVPDDGPVTVTLTLSAESATWAVDAAVKREGPCEFGLLVPAASVCAADGGVVYQLDDRLQQAAVDHCECMAVGRRLVLEQPKLSLAWSCEKQSGNWLFQDFRANDEKALRIIAVWQGAGPRAQLSATLTPTAYDDASAAQRAAVLDQRTRWRQPADVANGGFEDGPDGWNVPGNGAVVEDLAHAGRRCARLTVGDPARDSVYITRQIPVAGGSRYRARTWVRTQGVTAREGRMSSVGAGLIVEWADKAGKWLAPGDYACDLFGDHGWTQRESTVLRAPDDAGYAVIFLAVRAVGTAWFDDLELERVHGAIALAGPLPKARLDDNTPTLAWRPDASVERYTVELSRASEFPADGLVRKETQDESWTVPRAIPSGTWFWRVLAPGYQASATWSFEQTAAEDRDTTAPTLSGLLQRVTTADQPVVLGVADDVAGRPVTLEARSGERAARVSGAGGKPRVLPEGGWRPGLNELTVAARDAALDGAYECAGKRIFPCGIYQVTPAQMPRVKKAGFDVVHTYEWEGSQDDAAARRYLDAAWSNGLRVFIGFDRGNGSGRGLVQGNMDMVQRRVAALCDHPGLFCWYLFDEPEVPGQYVSPRQLIAYADAIRALDPYHPVVVTTWGNGMARYRRSFDTHWTQAYTTPGGVVGQLQEHRRLLGPECPLTLLVHCYDRKQLEVVRGGGVFDPARFQPDPDWLRGAAYAGITQHINGLWWWWYAAEAKDWPTVADVPAAWEALSRVVGQIHALEPVLAAPVADQAESLDVPGGKLWVWRRTVAGTTTVVAVNTGEQEVTARLPALGDGPAEVLFEDRRVARRGGSVEDRFGRYAVHVYRFR
ncbi:MAG: hypothetical protein HYU66_18190 [Armatimonadetes bacterium]|nr:hypothetical protein [Armatimonadota bacterium]